MIVYNKFSPAPVTTKRQAELLAMGVSFLKDEEGRCWYEVQKELVEKKLTAVLVNDDGLVVGFEADPTMVNPINLTVVGVDKVPYAFACDGNWIFDGKELTYSRVNLIDAANQHKTMLLTDAGTLKKVYEDRLIESPTDTNIIECINKISEYIGKLIAVDVNTAPGIDWPKPPIL